MNRRTLASTVSPMCCSTSVLLWRWDCLRVFSKTSFSSTSGMFHLCLFLTHTVARFNTLSPTLDHTGTVKAHLEVSDGVPCGLQHILALDPSKRHLKTAMAWTQSWACITSAFRRRTCEENPQITMNGTIHLIHRDLAEQVFKMYSGLSQSLLIISDRKLLSCHEPSIPVSSHVGWKVPTKTRPQ